MLTNLPFAGPVTNLIRPPLCESIRRSGSRNDPLANPLPVQPVEQRFELRARQMKDPLANLRPDEMTIAKPFVDQNEPASIP